jgi:hypothetical protein
MGERGGTTGNNIKTTVMKKFPLNVDVSAITEVHTCFSIT